jgi:dehydrogenase/reductase SDR family protein 7B
MGALFSKTESLSETTKNEYSNKSILLTGASRGLGRSLAHALSTCNPSLLILSGRDEKALEQVKNECLQIHGKTGNDGMRVECIPADLASKSSVEELATKSLQLSQIDVLINNGGISSRSSFVDTRLEVDELLMQVNFFSGVALAKSVVPGMVSNDGGRIVWISSVQGKGVYASMSYLKHVLS